jgi:hypothetical protein
LIVPFDTQISFQAFVALPKLKLDVALTPSTAGMIEPDMSSEPVTLVLFFILTGPSITTESDILALPYRTKLPDTSSTSPVAEKMVGSDPVTYSERVTINPSVNLPEPDTSNEALNIACEPVKLRDPIL